MFKVKFVALVAMLLLAVAACGDAIDKDVEEGSAVDVSEVQDEPSAADEGSNQPDRTVLEVAEAYTDARLQLDTGAALALMAPDVLVVENGFWPRTGDEIEELHKLYEATDFELSDARCEVEVEGPPADVICTVTTFGPWLEAGGHDPVESSYRLKIADGLVVEAALEFGDAWLENGFFPWFNFVAQNHEQDFMTIFRHDDNGDFTGGIATSDEGIKLAVDFTQEFLALGLGRLEDAAKSTELSDSTPEQRVALASEATSTATGIDRVLELHSEDYLDPFGAPLEVVEWNLNYERTANLERTEISCRDLNEIDSANGGALVECTSYLIDDVERAFGIEPYEAILTYWIRDDLIISSSIERIPPAFVPAFNAFIEEQGYGDDFETTCGPEGAAVECAELNVRVAKEAVAAGVAS